MEFSELIFENRRQIGEFITQVITFLIFYWVMAKYAWPAVRNLLDDRQRQIEEGFANIERRQAEAERLHHEYAERLRGIEQEARARLQEAVAEGRAVAAEITEAARQETARAAERAQRNIELEIARARVELRDEIVTMTIAATERLLRQRVDTETDRRLLDTFLADLEPKMPQGRN